MKLFALEKFPSTSSIAPTTAEDIVKASRDKDVYVRIGVARRLPELVEELGQRLLPVIHSFIDDDSPEVRVTVMEQILPLCAVFALGGQEGRLVISDQLLPIVINKLSDRDEETKQLAIQALSSLGGLVERKMIVEKTIPIIEKMAVNDANPKARIASIHLLNQLAPLLEKQLSLAFSVPLLKQLVKDTSYLVRAAIPSNLSKMCAVLGPSDTAKLILPQFTLLSRDPIWNVRRAAANGLVTMSQSLDSEAQKQLISVFLSLAEDKVRWVRMRRGSRLDLLLPPSTETKW